MVNGCDADRGSHMGEEGKINMGREKSRGGMGGWAWGAGWGLVKLCDGTTLLS